MGIITVQQYRAALTSFPKLPFRELQGRNFRLVLNAKNEPLRFFGSNSVVFKIADESGFYALKCYTTELDYRWEYLERVQATLSSFPKEWIVPFEIYRNELVVKTGNDETTNCHILLMPWIEGERLIDRLQYCCKHPDSHSSLEGLRQSLIGLANSHIGQPFSHGDISPENIIVTPSGNMMLVDHDSFVFQIWKSSSGRAGWNYAYQHPGRDSRKPELAADQFSFLVLATSLKALELNPGLFRQFNSTRGLLFTIDDFGHPGQSQLITELEKLEDVYFRELLNLLLVRLDDRSIPVPGLLDYLNASEKEYDDQKPCEGDDAWEGGGILDQRWTTRPITPTGNKLLPVKESIQEKEQFFLEELEKDIREKERELREAQIQAELRLIEQQKKNIQKTEKEIQELIVAERDFSDYDSERNLTHTLPRNQTKVFLQNAPKIIKAAWLIAITCLFIALTGISTYFPHDGNGEPPGFKNPSGNTIKNLNEGELSKGDNREIEPGRGSHDNQGITGIAIPPNGTKNKSSLFLTLKANEQGEFAQFEGNEKGNILKTKQALLKSNKKSFQNKRKNINTVTFRQSGF